MNISDNAAYLKGLAEGMEIDKESKEGKLLVKMLDLLAEMAGKIEVLEDENNDLYEYMEEMAKDIVDIEDDFYGEEEDQYSDREEYDDYSDLNDGDEEDYEDDDEIYYEVECPTCGEKICFSEEANLSSFICPACGMPIDESVLRNAEEINEGCGDCGCDGCDGCNTKIDF